MVWWADQEELLPTLGGRRVKKTGLGGKTFDTKRGVRCAGKSQDERQKVKKNNRKGQTTKPKE